jgi:hypothetical protein
MQMSKRPAPNYYNFLVIILPVMYAAFILWG